VIETRSSDTSCSGRFCEGYPGGGVKEVIKRGVGELIDQTSGGLISAFDFVFLIE
jgi:hypothetical protein